MDIHQNVRLTLRSREALVESANRSLGFSPAAASFHVTPKTAASGFAVISRKDLPDCGTAPRVRAAVPRATS
jgi:hypothetical protein